MRKLLSKINVLSLINDIPNMDYLNRRYAVYECLSEEDNWIIVNGETTFSEVNSRIKGIILRLTEHCY